MNKGIGRRTALVLAASVLTACRNAPTQILGAAPGPVPAPQSAGGPATIPPSDVFLDWLGGLRQEAARRGIGASTIDAALKDVAPIPRVIDLDRRQPEFSQTFSRYVANAVTDRRVTEGRALLGQHARLLAGLEREYGVQARFLVSFWGMETNYGRVTGDYPVIAALATLAYDGRRGAFFREELFNALKILDAGHISLARMTGSWAGAMGHTQFMPSTFLRFAVDRDGDRHINIWGSVPDALASGANYLRALGWNGERTWGREVRLPPTFDVGLSSLDVDATETVLPLAEWSARGVRRTDGRALPQQDISAALVLPQGLRGPAFLLYDNYRAILKWNRSAFYAIAVGHLADRLTGAEPIGALATGIEPLRREDVISLQEGLIAGGFLQGNADGVMGAATRQAVRRFQRAAALPPDGYADRLLIAAVRARTDGARSG